MRTVYLGTTDFAATVLAHLADSEHRPELVVTRPDRRRGRGRKLASPPVAVVARDLGIALEQPDDVNGPDVLARIGEAQPQALCLCAFGALIAEPLLSAGRWFNVHPSLLPRWRGAAPIERAIEAGDEQSGVSIMELVADLDAGPVYLQHPEPIADTDDYGSLAARLARLGGELLVRTLDEQPGAQPQPTAGVTYAEKIERGDRWLDPGVDAATLARRVRALRPHIGAFVELDGEPLGVLAAAASEGDVTPGDLVTRQGRLMFGASDRPLELLEVKPAGGRAMEAQAFLRGRGPVAST